MKKNAVLGIYPVIVLSLCTFVKYIVNVYNMEYNSVRDESIFLLSTYGMILIVPLYYLCIMCYTYIKNKQILKKTVGLISIYTLIIAVIACPYSIMHYIGITKIWILDMSKIDFIDFFPLYIVFPIIIIVLGFLIFKLIYRIIKKRQI